MGTRMIAVLAAVAAVAVLPAAAQADSIVYIKDGNVWSAEPDGSRQVPITASGGYSYASQADDGTLIALAPGERLHKLAPDGRLLADFRTFVSDGSPVPGPTNRFHGPFEPEISPDGTKVAFDWFNDTFSNGTNCNVTNDCFLYQSRKGVGITHSDRLTGHEEFGLLTGWGHPSWVDNSTLLRSYAGTALNDDTVFNQIAPGRGDDDLDRWFFDPQGGTTVNNVELARDRKAAVGIVGQGDEYLRVYRPTVDPFSAPDWNHSPFARDNVRVVEACYDYGEPIGGKFQSVSIAPDSRQIAYGVGNGIWVSDLPDLSGGCSTATRNELRIPGGSFPDWGPADPPARTVVTHPPGTQRPGDGGVPGGQDGPGGDTPAGRLSIGRVKARLATALRKGLPVTVRASGPGTVRVTALSGRTKVASGSARAGTSGRARVTARFTSRARRALGRKRSARLVLRVTYKPGQGAPVRRTAAVTIKR